MSELNYPKFGVAADPVIIKDGKILLMKRNYEPFKGKWEFPGGFFEPGETIEQTCVREAKEETGLDIEPIDVLGVYTDPERDPRGQTVGVAFVCKLKGGELEFSEEAEDARWFDIDDIDLSEMGFDHAKIISDLRKWMKSKGTYWTKKT